MKLSRLSLLLAIISVLTLSTVKAQISADLPNPPANLKTLPAGSYVIAMDNDNQPNGNTETFAPKPNMTIASGATVGTVSSALNIRIGAVLSGQTAVNGRTVVAISGLSITISSPASAALSAKPVTFTKTVNNFNCLVYGYLHYLLDSPHVRKLKWIIRSGKAKDAIDFSVNATRVRPTLGTAANFDFKSGPFVVFQPDTAGVTAMLDTFNNAHGTTLRLYRTNADVTVDQRYDLSGFHPKAAVLNDGGNGSIHVGYMTSCGIPTKDYTVETTPAFITTCFTFASEPHNTSAPNSVIQGIRTFVQAGGNFFGQCEAGNAYENNPTYGHFQTTTGITDANNGDGPNTEFLNPDLAFAQFEGNLSISNGGSLQNWRINAAGQNGNHIYARSSLDNTVITAMGSKLVASNVRGGMVFYAGSHKFDLSDELNISGMRMYHNAFLIPTRYPNCPQQGTLAVKLKYFYVKKVNDHQAQLYWTTLLESNSKAFSIQRSSDGVNFDEIAVVPSHGNSNVELSYSTSDFAPLKGKNFYRLVEVSLDDHFTYSDIVVANFNSNRPNIEVYPNPSYGGQVNVNFDNLPVVDNKVDIIDMMGKKVMSLSGVMGTSVKLNVSSLNPGNYVVRVSGSNGDVVQSKLVVTKN